MLMVMESVWVQLLVGVLAVVGLFAGAVLGALVLTCTPLRQVSGETGRRRHASDQPSRQDRPAW